MAILRCGIDHYAVVSDTGVEAIAVYGEPCILADEETGDILFAFLDVPADDGTVRGAMGLGAVVYRLDLPDQEEPTTVEDLPDGFEWENDPEYQSPFGNDDEEEIEVDTEDEGDADDDDDPDADEADEDEGKK